MNQSKPLTAEEAKKLTFPCLLEVWDYNRMRSIVLVNGFMENVYIASNGTVWRNAALPSPEIAEAMRKQFGSPSEYPKRMLVWDNNEARAIERIVLADLGEKADNGRYIVVSEYNESKFENGEKFNWSYYKNAKPIPEPDAISQEIEELRKKLADLEAKHNKQSK